jgi:hypothetical protein
MKWPRLGESSLGALVGAMTGALGGLVAVGLPVAVLNHDLTQLLAARTLGLLGLVISAPIGWLLGGQIGPRLENFFGPRGGGIVGGIIGGLVPVATIAVWSWHMITAS